MSSETSYFERAAGAQADETHRLGRFLSPYQAPRPFHKHPGELTAGARAASLPITPEAGRQRTAFGHLRDELGLLLGPAGGHLVLEAWSHQALSPSEADPERLRTALERLRPAAARLAATRGSSRPLQALVRAFEASYLPTPRSEKEPGPDESLPRWSRSGQAANLLPSLLGGPQRSGVSAPAPRLGQDERARQRREFLFESSCRARSWSEAYRPVSLSRPARERSEAATRCSSWPGRGSDDRPARGTPVSARARWATAFR